MTTRIGQSVPPNLEQLAQSKSDVVPKKPAQTLGQIVTKIAIVGVPVILGVAAAVIAAKYFSGSSDSTIPEIPEYTIKVFSYNDERYLCSVTNSCMENLGECVRNLKGSLNYGTGIRQMDDGSTIDIFWSSVPENCVRFRGFGYN